VDIPEKSKKEATAVALEKAYGPLPFEVDFLGIILQIENPQGKNPTGFMHIFTLGINVFQ